MKISGCKVLLALAMALLAFAVTAAPIGDFNLDEMLEETAVQHFDNEFAAVRSSKTVSQMWFTIQTCDGDKYSDTQYVALAYLNSSKKTVMSCVAVLDAKQTSVACTDPSANEDLSYNDNGYFVMANATDATSLCIGQFGIYDSPDGNPLSSGSKTAKELVGGDHWDVDHTKDKYTCGASHSGSYCDNTGRDSKSHLYIGNEKCLQAVSTLEEQTIPYTGGLKTCHKVYHCNKSDC